MRLQKNDVKLQTIFCKLSHSENPEEEGVQCPWLTSIARILNAVGMPLKKDVCALLSTFYPELWGDAEKEDPDCSAGQRDDEPDILMVENNAMDVEGV